METALHAYLIPSEAGNFVALLDLPPQLVHSRVELEHESFPRHCLHSDVEM